MRNARVIFHAQRRMFENAIALAIATRDDHGRISVAEPIMFRAIAEGAYIEPASLALSLDDAQALMDELWHVGLRPSEGTGSAGAMAAVQAHLADMRRLVFKDGEAQ